MSETQPEKHTIGQAHYKDVPGEVCFSQELYSHAALLFFPQTFLIWAFIKHGFGYEYLLLSVAIVNLGLYAHARHYLVLGKTKKLKPFSIVTGYVVLTGLLYGFPMALVGTLLMTGTYRAGIPVSETFLENNSSLVTWLAGLDLLGNRPTLDLRDPKNVLNVYYLTLVLSAATLSLVMSLLLLPAKLRGWRHLFEVSGKNQPVFGKALLFSAMAGTSAYFCTASNPNTHLDTKYRPAASYRPALRQALGCIRC